MTNKTIISQEWWFSCHARRPFFRSSVLKGTQLIDHNLYLFGDDSYYSTSSTKTEWGVVNGNCKEGLVQLAFFFASLRNFDFLNCKTKTLKRFKCEHETFRPHIWKQRNKLWLQDFLAFQKINILRHTALRKNQGCEMHITAQKTWLWDLWNLTKNLHATNGFWRITHHS